MYRLNSNKIWPKEDKPNQFSFEWLKSKKKLSNKISKRRLHHFFERNEIKNLNGIFDYEIGDKVFLESYGILTISRIKPIVYKPANLNFESKKGWYIYNFIIYFQEFDYVKMNWFSAFWTECKPIKNINMKILKENALDTLNQSICNNPSFKDDEWEKELYFLTKIISEDESNVFNEDFSYKKEFLNNILNESTNYKIKAWYFPENESYSGCFCGECF